MSYRDKFPKGPDWKESDGNAHGVTTIHITNKTSIKKLEKYRVLTIDLMRKQLKDAQDCLAVRDKYWADMRHELYYCRRNQRIVDIVEGTCEEKE